MPIPIIPKVTCPAINRVIKHLGNAENLIQKAIRRSLDSDELKEVLEEVDYELSGLTGEMQDLRSDNAQLRDCAEYYQHRCAELESLLSELNIT